MHDGRRHQARLAKDISCTVAGELVRVQRAAVLKGEAGIGRKRLDIGFDDAKDEFLKWADANKRTRTARTYRQCLEALARSFAGKRLAATAPSTSSTTSGPGSRPACASRSTGSWRCCGPSTTGVASGASTRATILW